MTRILTRSQIAALEDVNALIPMLEAAFRAYSTRDTPRGLRVYSPLPGNGASMILVPGVVPDIPAYSVKVHSKFPAAPPGIKGALLLTDLNDGRLLAIMNSTLLTAIRTGLSAALATHRLARTDADSVAVIGAGVQGEFQLRYLARLRPIRRVRVYDTVSEHARAYADRFAAELGISMVVCGSIEEAVAPADIVLMATWSRQPILFAPMLRPGTHVTTLGADQPGEAELGADVIRAGVFVCDDRVLAVEQGAVGGVGLGPEAIDAELGEILAGVHSGRVRDDQITIYGAVGLAFQDLVTAWQIYQAALAQQVGLEVDLLA